MMELDASRRLEEQRQHQEEEKVEEEKVEEENPPTKKRKRPAKVCFSSSLSFFPFSHFFFVLVQ